MILLLDQDNVLADFEAGFRQAWAALHPDIPPVPEHERRSFALREDYPAELRSEVDAIIQAPGFYHHLPPVAGAGAAVSELLAEGIEVFICTSPPSQYQNCVLEKYQWVEEHLGPEFTRRIVMTHDKIRADVLIDDKPEVWASRSRSEDVLVCPGPPSLLII